MEHENFDSIEADAGGVAKDRAVFKVVQPARRDLREAWLREKLPEMGLHLSERERRASEAERELIEWKKVRFMAGRLGERVLGYATGVQAFGLFVELDEVYVQGLVHVSSMTDDYYRFDERAHRLQGENTKKAYRLGDRVEVQVARVDLERRQIDFALVDVLARTVVSPAEVPIGVITAFVGAPFFLFALRRSGRRAS